MIEQATSDFDMYADLSHEGEDVEGITDFFPNKKPAVRIAMELSLEGSRRHRLRTTLAHEYGHVKFHSFLWDINQPRPPVSTMMKTISRQKHRFAQLRQTFSVMPNNNVFQSCGNPNNLTPLHNTKSGSCFRCSRSHIFDAPASDWMEWQASYACGAFLMPISVIHSLVSNSPVEINDHHLIAGDSGQINDLLSAVSLEFDVSIDAAHIRLIKLGYLPALI
jgi:hypothetical protein